MKNKIIFGLLCVILFSFPFVTAYAEVSAQVSSIFFTKTLQLGSAGDQVSGLQELLRRFSDIYPEGLITGNFGFATENAVKRFQINEGIVASGIVDLITRTRLNNLLANSVPEFPNTGTTTVAPVVVPIFPDTGSLPEGNSPILNIVIIIGTSIVALVLILLVVKKRKSNHWK